MKKDIYKRINKHNKVINSVDGSSLAELFGGSTGTQEVNKNNVLKLNSTALSCIQLIASTLSQCPIEHFKVDIESEYSKEKVVGDISNLISIRPNTFQGATAFWQQFFTNMLVHGAGYALINTKRGIPNELIILDSKTTYLDYINGKYWCVTTLLDGSNVKIPYEKIIYVPDVLEGNSIVGVSRLESLKKTLNISKNINNMADDYFQNSGKVTGVINVPSNLDGKARANIKEAFVSTLNSSSGNVAVISDGMEFKSVSSLSLVDSEFINSAKLTTLDIARVYQVPPPLIGELDGANYSNMVELSKVFYSNLLSTINKVEDELRIKLFSKEDVSTNIIRFDISSKLRSNEKDMAEYYGRLIQNGVLSINEVRNELDYQGVVNGDLPRVDLNHVSIDIAQEYQLSKTGYSKDEVDATTSK